MEKHPEPARVGEGALGAALVLWAQSQTATKMRFGPFRNLSTYRVPGIEQGPGVR